jgi:hypothetical protein
VRCVPVVGCYPPARTVVAAARPRLEGAGTVEFGRELAPRGQHVGSEQPHAAHRIVVRHRAVTVPEEGGNVHDLLIAHTCAVAGLPLTTLDCRQAALARPLPGLAVTVLLPDGTESVNAMPHR